MTNPHFTNYSHYYSYVLPSLGIADLMSSYAGADHDIIILLNQMKKFQMVVYQTSVIKRDFKRSPRRALNTASQSRCQLSRLLGQGTWGVTDLKQHFPLSALRPLYTQKMYCRPKSFHLCDTQYQILKLRHFKNLLKTNNNKPLNVLIKMTYFYEKLNLPKQKYLYIFEKGHIVLHFYK